jgi:hypothetical protein
MESVINIYIKKKNSKGVYKTKYGIPFQCVELIRRFFSTIKNVSFPSVVDAVDFFNRIDVLSGNENDKLVKLKTYEYPYTKTYSHYLKPGSILFWKYKKPSFIYGHVALILDSNDSETIIIQQNLNPPVKIYNTKTLFDKINNEKSKFLGIKTIPKSLSKNINLIKYNVISL